MIDWDKALLKPLMSVFGESITYSPAIGSAFPISGIFDEAYHDVDLAGGMGVTSAQPVVGVRLSEFLTQPQQDDVLTVIRTGETFKVKEVRIDGHGSAKLMLNLNY